MASVDLASFVATSRRIWCVKGFNTNINARLNLGFSTLVMVPAFAGLIAFWKSEIALLDWSVVIGATIIAALIAYLTARSVVPDIKALADATTRLADGDEGVSIPAVDRPDEIGEMARALAVLKDNRAATLQLNARLVDIAENLSGVVYRRIHHTDGRISIVYAKSNQGIYTRSEYCTQSSGEFDFDPTQFMTLIHPDDRPVWGDRMKSATTVLEPCSYEMRFLAPDGSVKWRKTMELPYRLANGDVIWDGIAQDVTELKQSEQALRDGEARLKATLDTATDGVITIDEQGVIETANSVAERIFGFSSAELVGRKFAALAPSVHLNQQGQCLVRRHNVKDDPLMGNSCEVEGRHKNGEVFPMDMSVSEPYWAGKQMFTLIVRDLARRRSLEEKLRRAQKMEALGNLAGAIAHDFNNTLFPIITITEVVMEDLPQGKMRENLEKVVTAAKRGQDLVRQIMAYSRRQPVSLEPVNLSEIVNETTTLLQAMLPSTTRISVGGIEDVGPVLADATQIHEVIMNLGTNAAHAIGSKTGEMRIDLRHVEIGEFSAASLNGLAPGPYAQLVVSDTGCGMSKETMAKIFDPYFTTKSAAEGTGLGLAAVRGIIASHEGAIHVTSEPDQGTVFTIYLPLLSKKCRNPNR